VQLLQEMAKSINNKEASDCLIAWELGPTHTSPLVIDLVDGQFHGGHVLNIQ
jgi:hypothetical protein